MSWIFTEPATGKVSASLPNPWIDTRPGREGRQVSGLNRSNCESFGWLKEWIEPEPVAVIRKFSKLKIIRNLKDLGLWDTVKGAIEQNGVMDEWGAAEYMREDDSDFMTMLNAIGQSIPGFDIENLLSNSIWEEE